MPAPELRIVFTPDGAATVESAVVRTERAAAKAAEEAKRSADAQARAAEKAEAALVKAAAAGEAATSRLAGGARQASFALETMARTGQTAGEPLRQLLVVGGEMAFMFGPQGAIAGAVAVLGLTIATLFSKGRTEMDETRAQFQRQVAGLIDDGDMIGLQQRAAKLWRGVFDVDQGTWRDGVGALMAQRAKIATDPNQLFRDAVLKRFDARTVEIDGEKRAVGELIREYEKLTALLRNPPPLPRALTGARPITITGTSPNSGGATNEPPRPFSGRLTDMARFWQGQLGDKGESADSILARQFNPQALRGTVPMDFGIDVGEVTKNIERVRGELQKALQKTQEELDRESKRVGAVVMGGLADGIATAVRTLDLGAGFKQMTAGILAGIGGMMIETGQAMVTFGTLIEAFKKSLLSFFGGNAVLAGLALVASGAVLQGLSGRLGNLGPRVATGGDRAIGGGFGIPGTASIPVSLNRGSVAATPAAVPALRESVTNYLTVIGEDDPRAQRAIVRLLTNAAQRGYLVPA